MGALIAGALAGGGVATERAGLEWQKAEFAKDLEDKRNNFLMSLEDKRNTNARAMETEVRQPFQTAERVGQQNFTAGENKLTRDVTTSEGAANRTSHENISIDTNATHLAVADLNRQSQERIAKLGRDTQIAVASIGVTPVTTQDGTIQLLHKDGKITAAVGADGKPLTAKKDLSESAKVYVDVLGKQATAVSKTLQDGMLDTAGQERARGQLADINARILHTLTTDKLGGGGDAPYPDGTKLKGKDGQPYIVKDGKPVLESAAAAPATAASPAAIPRNPPAPAYVPPAGSPAAKAQERRQGLVAQARDAEGAARDAVGASAQATTQIRDDFNVDARALTPAQLVQKYDGTPQFQQLAAEQKSVIFEARKKLE